MKRNDGREVDFQHVGASAWKRFWLYWWVVPRAQWDLLDVEYQIYVFQLFHGDRRTKIIHYTTITLIAFFHLVFFAQWPLWTGAPVFASWAVVYGVFVVALHARPYLTRGLSALWLGLCGLLVVMGLGATSYYQLTRVPGAAWYAPTSLAANPLLWIYVFSLIETISHSLEPVPPYSHNHDRWLSPAEFRKEGGVWLALGALAMPTLFTFTSFFSNPRSLSTVVLRVMMAAGYRRELRDSIDAAVAAEWRSGQPWMHSVPRLELPPQAGATD